MSSPQRILHPYRTPIDNCQRNISPFRRQDDDSRESGGQVELLRVDTRGL